jgi:FKBP-type peptidyl-prolyl cis-trans isomerase
MRAHAIARTQAEEGAVQTASGLVIQHVEEGKGRHPAPNSKVKGKITHIKYFGAILYYKRCHFTKTGAGQT